MQALNDQLGSIRATNNRIVGVGFPLNVSDTNPPLSPGRCRIGPHDCSNEPMTRGEQHDAWSRPMRHAETEERHWKGMGLGILRMWVVSACGLASPASCGGLGTPNPFARLRFAGREAVTPTIYSSTTPKWDTSEFFFEVPSRQEDAEPFILVEVLDAPTMPLSADGRSQKEIILGRMRLSVKAVIQDYEEIVEKRRQMNRRRRERVQLLDAQGYPQSSATIVVDVLFEPYAALSHATPTPVERSSPIARRCLLPGTLEVVVRKAINLVDKDTGFFGDVSDPYVTLKLASQPDEVRQRTATKSNDLNPVWNGGPFLFSVEDALDDLELVVMDEDHRYKEDDFLGKMTIPLERVIASCGKSFTIHDRLVNIDHGELEVKLTYMPRAWTTSLGAGRADAHPGQSSLRVCHIHNTF